MNGEFIKPSHDSAAQVGDVEQNTELIQQWADYYWHYFTVTRPEAPKEIEAALEHPVYGAAATELLTRAESTVDLVLSVRDRQIGAVSVQFSDSPEQLAA